MTALLDLRYCLVNESRCREPKGITEYGPGHLTEVVSRSSGQNLGKDQGYFRIWEPKNPQGPSGPWTDCVRD